MATYGCQNFNKEVKRIFWVKTHHHGCVDRMEMAPVICWRFVLAGEYINSYKSTHNEEKNIIRSSTLKKNLVWGENGKEKEKEECMLSL
jgi:hypothetical protein